MTPYLHTSKTSKSTGLNLKLKHVTSANHTLTLPHYVLESNNARKMKEKSWVLQNYTKRKSCQNLLRNKSSTELQPSPKEKPMPRQLKTQTPTTINQTSL